MRRLIVIALIGIIGTSCTTSDDSPEPLEESLADIAAEVNGRVAAFFETLGQPYEDRAQLYTRLIDLQLPTTFAVELDKARRVEPPPGSEPLLERYTGLIGELLLASEQLDSAIATEDPAATALAAVTMEVASGALAVVLPTGVCGVLVPDITADLCGRDGLEEYEDALDLEIRRFVASFRPVFRIPDTFGDVIRARVLGDLQDDATLVLQNTATRLEAIQPPPAYERLHRVLVDYFPRAAEAWAEFPADPTGSDPLLYGFLVDGLERIRSETRTALRAEYGVIRSARPESQIEEILRIWFDPPVDAAE